MQVDLVVIFIYLFVFFLRADWCIKENSLTFLTLSFDDVSVTLPPSGGGACSALCSCNTYNKYNEKNKVVTKQTKQKQNRNDKI